MFNIELTYGRHNSCTHSAYYVWFHVAIAALIQAALTSPAPRLLGEDPGGIYDLVCLDISAQSRESNAGRFQGVHGHRAAAQ